VSYVRLIISELVVDGFAISVLVEAEAALMDVHIAYIKPAGRFETVH